jgi:metal-dependent hydrolase (beta-lactamase superfamily II)
MKITTIVDNLVQTTTTLAGQWGLSFYLEVEEVDGRIHGIVFDTGSTKEAYN